MKVRKFGRKSTFGRPAQPAELAPAYVYLASGESSYVTGSVIDLTGRQATPLNVQTFTNVHPF